MACSCRSSQIIHNELDYRLPVTEGIAMFNVLQSRGVPSKFLYFPDENHVSFPCCPWHEGGSLQNVGLPCADLPPSGCWSPRTPSSGIGKSWTGSTSTRRRRTAIVRNWWRDRAAMGRHDVGHSRK